MMSPSADGGDAAAAAAQLERVRNRLVSSPDSKLPHILRNLLPRLVPRFEKVIDTNVGDNVGLPDPNLVGIFEHLLDRIRLNENIVEISWVEALFHSVMCLQSGKGDVTCLQCTLPVLEFAVLKVDSADALPNLISILERLHYAISILPVDKQNEEENNNVNEVASDDEGEEVTDNATSNTLLNEVWERVSWMVVEQVAKKTGIFPILDWDCVGDQWDTFNVASGLKQIHDYQPNKEEKNVASHGMYCLLMDAITFHYKDDPTNISRWQFRRKEGILDVVRARQQRRAEERAATATMARNHNGPRTFRQVIGQERDPSCWNEAEENYWRAIQRSLESYSVMLFDNVDRENIFRIITCQVKPITTAVYKPPKASEMYKYNARKKAKEVEKEQRQSCSLTVGVALLHLILGDSQAQKFTNNKTISPFQQMLLGDCTTNPHMTRRPLPKIFAQRAFKYLSTANFIFSESNCSDWELFLDLLSELKNIRSLEVNISDEIYEEIGARTQPSICWTVRFLWKFSEYRYDNDNGEFYSMISKRGWNAAVELLDQLQDIAVERLRRDLERATASRITSQMSQNQLFHDHREKLALKSPFVAEAVQARIDAYKLMSKYAAVEKMLSTDGNQICWDNAIRLLNCAAFDHKKETLPALQEACISVTLIYRQAVMKPDQISLEVSMNPMLLPLLKASTSFSDWSRELSLQWAQDVVYYADPSLSYVILICLSSDEVPSIAQRADDALNRLKFPSLQSKSSSSAISFFDLGLPDEKEKITNHLQGYVVNLANEHGLSTKASRLILQGFDFSVEDANKALKKDFDSTVASCGVPFSCKNPDTKNSDGGGTTCEICYDEIPIDSGFALQCSHKFCSECWQRGLSAAVEGTPEDLVNFKCLQHGCDVRLTKEDLEEIAPAMIPKMEQATLDWFLIKSPEYCFCPGPDCTAVASINQTEGSGKRKQAICRKCNTSFCFQCGKEPHQPVACEVRLKYKAASDRIRAREEEVENKTIECPNCGVSVQKNGGCNHMTCRCGHEFCWICLSPSWQDHVCNMFESLNGMDDTERVLFFMPRVDAHDHSAAAAKRQLDDFDKHTRKLQEQSPFCEHKHLEVLRECWEALVVASNFLANSYIAAYGMTEVDEKVRIGFESRQSQLQVFVEQLNLLSGNITASHAIKSESDFQARFKRLRFCTVAIYNYIMQVESFMNHHFD